MSQSTDDPSADRHEINVIDTLKSLIKSEMRGMRTASTCIVEEVNEQDRRVTVSLKTDSNVLIDNVPIASPFASNGFGMIHPVSKRDEGLLIHTNDPLEDQLKEAGHVKVDSDRRFQLESAVFFSEFWVDKFDIPKHAENEFLLSLEDGDDKESLRMSMKGNEGVFQLQVMDAGTAKASLTMNKDGSSVITHVDSGNQIIMHADGTVTLGDSASSKPALNEDAEMNDTFLGLGGGVKNTGTSDTEVS